MDVGHLHISKSEVAELMECSNHIHRAWCALAYLLAWPGMNAEAFLSSSGRVSGPRVREWLGAVLVTGAGAADNIADHSQNEVVVKDAVAHALRNVAIESP